MEPNITEAMEMPRAATSQTAETFWLTTGARPMLFITG